MRKSLQEICDEHEVNLAELGRRIGRSRQYMSELARGNIRMTYDMAVRIADALGTTPDILFLDEKSNSIVPDIDNRPATLDTGTEGR